MVIEADRQMEHDFRLLPWCKWDIHPSGMLHDLDWLLVTNLSGQPNVKQSSWTASPMKMGPIGCPETLVTIYKSTLCNIPAGRRHQIYCIFEGMRMTQNDSKLWQNIEQLRDIMHCPFLNSYCYFSGPCNFYIQGDWGGSKLLWNVSLFASQHGVISLKILHLSVTLWKPQPLWTDRLLVFVHMLYITFLFLLLCMGSSRIITLSSLNLNIFYANTFSHHQTFHLLVFFFKLG
jgi:hypothetical protein